MARTNETRNRNNVNLGLVFVIISNVGIKINADGNAKS